MQWQVALILYILPIPCSRKEAFRKRLSHINGLHMHGMGAVVINIQQLICRFANQFCVFISIPLITVTCKSFALIKLSCLPVSAILSYFRRQDSVSILKLSSP